MDGHTSRRGPVLESIDLAYRWSTYAQCATSGALIVSKVRVVGVQVVLGHKLTMPSKNPRSGDSAFIALQEAIAFLDDFLQMVVSPVAGPFGRADVHCTVDHLARCRGSTH